MIPGAQEQDAEESATPDATLRASTSPLVPPLPPVGPVWFSSVMGIGVAANLVDTFWQQHVAAIALLAASWVVLAVLVVGFLVRCLRERTVLVATMWPVDEAPMWGTVSMALLTVGSATSTVIPETWPRLTAASWHADLVLWLLGTGVGLASTVAFTLRLLGRACGRPAMTWALAVVAPMVSATSGALLVPHVPAARSVGLLVASVVCFCTALFMGWAVLAGACHHAWRVERVPLPASCTVWIPVALVGQSVAAIVAITRALATMMVQPYARQVTDIATWFGWLVLVAGAPLVVWAVLVVVQAFREAMPFNPSWWSLTFPMGSMALGCHLFAEHAGVREFEWAGGAWTVALCAAVTLCTLATLHSLLRRARRRHDGVRAPGGAAAPTS